MSHSQIHEWTFILTFRSWPSGSMTKLLTVYIKRNVYISANILQLKEIKIRNDTQKRSHDFQQRAAMFIITWLKEQYVMISCGGSLQKILISTVASLCCCIFPVFDVGTWSEQKDLKWFPFLFTKVAKKCKKKLLESFCIFLSFDSL